MARCRKGCGVPAQLPSDPPAGVALFDLDGTLLAWDCQLLFRHFVVRREPWRAVFLPVFLAALLLAPVLRTDGLKRVFLSYLFGMDAATLAEHSRKFAAAVLPIIYPELRERLEIHRRNGDFLILASASPEIYVAEIGRALGFDLTLGTQIEIAARCPLFPDLENHKGAEKVRRLRAVLPGSWFREDKLPNCHGYTDSTADLPMLTLCDRVTLVNPNPALAEFGENRSAAIVRPPRPWRSRGGFFLRVLGLLTGVGRDPGGLSAGNAVRKMPASGK